MTRVRSAAAVCCALVTITAGASARSASETGNPARLLGTWRGTSVCTDRVAAPSCRDETVVYELTAGKSPGTVHWAADKVVEGTRLTGTARLLPGNETVRKLDLRKD